MDREFSSGGQRGRKRRHPNESGAEEGSASEELHRQLLARASSTGDARELFHLNANRAPGRDTEDPTSDQLASSASTPRSPGTFLGYQQATARAGQQQYPLSSLSLLGPQRVAHNPLDLNIPLLQQAIQYNAQQQQQQQQQEQQYRSLMQSYLGVHQQNPYGYGQQHLHLGDPLGGSSLLGQDIPNSFLANTLGSVSSSSSSDMHAHLFGYHNLPNRLQRSTATSNNPGHAASFSQFLSNPNVATLQGHASYQMTSPHQNLLNQPPRPGQQVLQSHLMPVSSSQQLQHGYQTEGVATNPRAKISSVPTNNRCQLLYDPDDEDCLNPYQAFARQQIEFFEAGELDKTTGAQGRNRPIETGQVGIRCIHCATLPPVAKARASTYYPSRLDILYQSAQNIVNEHLPKLCESIPDHVRRQIFSLNHKRSKVGGGKLYWKTKAMEKGVVDTEDGGLRFRHHDSNKS